MDSPSAQLVEPSMLDFDAPPSSPFVTEIDSHNRSPSKQWNPPSSHASVEEEDLTTSPRKPMAQEYEEDKENVPQNDATLAKLFATPRKQATPEPSPSRESPLKDSRNADLMPPPSTVKINVSPKKTPRKISANVVQTPRSTSRGSSSDRTPAQSVGNFQAGLDMRNASFPTEDQTNVDDTCFSTFSEIPDMTVFARLGQSPTRRGNMLNTPGGYAERTPRTSRKRSSSRSPSPTPRKQKTPPALRADDTGSFLIDFTQQLEGVPTNFASTSPAKSQTESNLLQYINNQRSPNKASLRSRSNQTSTPNKNLLNLLDFELPPAPTPRSIPTITVRELESLKSSYLSQISSLKATLSGREAEVESLKKAVGDAERRVGEAQEALRDENSKREHLEQENESWKKRGVEFESVLKNVKQEVLKSETEKDEMNRKLEDSEKRAEEAELRAVKAEERFADALTARMSGSVEGDAMEEQVQRLVSAQLDSKVEAVSRDLHAVYKEKHERKVASLKKSYEARSEKKTLELQARVSELERSNEELQAARDATFSGPVAKSALSDENAELKAQLEAQNAAIARLESEMHEGKLQQEQLQRDLKHERIEKGDLVAAVDEMLALQATAGAEPPATPQGARAMSVVEDFRKSISRPASGLRAPGGGVPGVGRSAGVAAPALNRSTSGSSAPALGGVGKSRILANIERMGRTGSSHGALE